MLQILTGYSDTDYLVSYKYLRIFRLADLSKTDRVKYKVGALRYATEKEIEAYKKSGNNEPVLLSKLGFYNIRKTFGAVPAAVIKIKNGNFYGKLKVLSKELGTDIESTLQQLYDSFVNEPNYVKQERDCYERELHEVRTNLRKFGSILTDFGKKLGSV